MGAASALRPPCARVNPFRRADELRLKTRRIDASMEPALPARGLTRARATAVRFPSQVRGANRPRTVAFHESQLARYR